MPRARTRPFADAAVPASAWRRAQDLAYRSGLLPHVRVAMHKSTGAPRYFTAEALLVGLIAHSLLQRSGLVTDIARTFATLAPSQRRDVGLGKRPVTHRMVDHAINRLLDYLEHDPGETALLSFCNQVLASSAQAAPCTQTGAVAIDSTDYEAYARRRSWASRIDSDSDALPAESPVPRRFVNERGWPRVGPDGRLQHTVDPDARDGYRSGHNGRPGEVFCGYDLHLAATIPTKDHPYVPTLIVGMNLAPAGSHKGHAGIALLDALRDPARPAVRQAVHEVVADRGYSYCTAPTWIHPLWARSIEPTSDLHPNQRGAHPGPTPGTIWLDGTLFSDALPETFRNLGSFTIGLTKQARTALHDEYDKQAQWAFVPHGKRQRNGRQRLKGPALAAQVRCPNYSPSMRLPLDRPTTSCPPGTDCACGKTLTIGPDDYAATQQRLVWGTLKWGRSYYRRNRVESANAELKHHRQALRRGFTRVLGQAKTSLLLAFAILGVNVSIIASAEGDTLEEAEEAATIPRARSVRAYRRRRERRCTSS